MKVVYSRAGLPSRPVALLVFNSLRCWQTKFTEIGFIWKQVPDGDEQFSVWAVGATGVWSGCIFSTMLVKNVQKPFAMVVASVFTIPNKFMGLVVEDLAPVALFGITLLTIFQNYEGYQHFHGLLFCCNFPLLCGCSCLPDFAASCKHSSQVVCLFFEFFELFGAHNLVSSSAV